MRGKRILVTGGAGFISSALVRQLVIESDYEVIIIDKLTYADDLASLKPVASSSRLRFIQADICNHSAMAHHIHAIQPDGIIHLAAETHVDRSVDGPATFDQTNIIGTFTLLDIATSYWRSLPTPQRSIFRFHHVSTDEVFGSLPPNDLFTEQSRYDPRSPYSASKEGSDHLVRAWQHTYGLPVVLTNCSNNFSPFHFPDKLVPLMITKSLRGKSLPIYGDGSNIRDWLHVDDHVAALRTVYERAGDGETYLIGGRSERTNLMVVHSICDALDQMLPRQDGQSYREQIGFVADRPGHDFRYAIDPSRLERDLRWKPARSFESAIVETVQSYLDNKPWWQAIMDNSYLGERLGVEGMAPNRKGIGACVE